MKKIILKALLVFMLIGIFLFLNSMPKVTVSGCLEVPDSQKETCFREELQKVYKKSGLVGAMDYVKGSYKSDQSFAGSCHSYMHLLGEWSFAEYGKKKSLDINADTIICGFGFYHGFMVELFKKKADYSVAADFCLYANSKLKLGDQLLNNDCYHGIGHGVTDFNKENIFSEADLQLVADNSIVTCKKVTNSDWEKMSSCMNGVYHSISDLIMNVVDKNKPLGFCMQQKDVYVPICLSAFGTVLMSVFNEDFDESLKYAATVGDDFAMLVIQPMSGYQGYKTVKNKDYDSSIKSCARLSQKLNLSCIRGMMEGVRDFGTPGKEAEEVMTYCNNKMMTMEQRNECIMYAVGTFDQYFGLGNKARVCSLLSKTDYEVFCK